MAPKKKYPCSLCPDVFTVPQQLGGHMRSVHPGVASTKRRSRAKVAPEAIPPDVGARIEYRTERPVKAATIRKGIRNELRLAAVVAEVFPGGIQTKDIEALIVDLGLIETLRGRLQ